MTAELTDTEHRALLRYWPDWWNCHAVVRQIVSDRESALREEIAAAIEAMPRMAGSEHYAHGRETAIEDAARIARGIA